MIPRSAQLAALLVVLTASTAAGQPAAGDPNGGPGGATARPADAGLPAAVPESAGMSSEGLARIGPAMHSYVDDGRLAGVMTMVARHGQVVHWETTGMRDVAAGDPLEPDDIFRIYSMTKPLTSVAVMILVEEGAVALDDPVSKFIPAFAGVTVLNDAGERAAPARPMTVEHLLTHTSGLTYGFFGDSPVDRIYGQSGFFTQAEGLDDFARRVADLRCWPTPATGGTTACRPTSSAGWSRSPPDSLSTLSCRRASSIRSA